MNSDRENKCPLKRKMFTVRIHNIRMPERITVVRVPCMIRHTPVRFMRVTCVPHNSLTTIPCQNHESDLWA